MIIRLAPRNEATVYVVAVFQESVLLRSGFHPKEHLWYVKNMPYRRAYVYKAQLSEHFLCENIMLLS